MINKDICLKFVSKSNLNLSNLYFICEGKTVDLNLTFEQLSKETNNKSGKIYVLVHNTNDNSKEETMEISKDIICPYARKFAI